MTEILGQSRETMDALFEQNLTENKKDEKEKAMDVSLVKVDKKLIAGVENATGLLKRVNNELIERVNRNKQFLSEFESRYEVD